MPTVSVIIPTYNRSNLVKEAVESVLQQTYTDFELIVVDDGSTDDTRSVVKQIQDSRVKYFYKENSGQSSGRNLGLIKAQGQFVAFLDSDDLWSKNYLEVMINSLRAYPEYSAVYARVYILTPQGEKRNLTQEHRYKSGWLTKDFFHGSPCILPSASVFRRDILKDFAFDENMKRGEDDDAFMRLSVRTPFLFVPDTYFLYRPGPNSVSRNSISIDEYCNGILALERFYYQLGGDKFISPILARKGISNKCRRMGKVVYRTKNRTAALILFKRALRYYPFDIRLYFDLLKAFLLSSKNDPHPEWKMPKPLSLCMTVIQKLKNVNLF